MAKGAKKSATEASNMFHKIMKASVSKPMAASTEDSICPQCGAMAKYVPPTTKNGKELTVNFICPNGHTFNRMYTLK